jgi:hypothetical protein
VLTCISQLQIESNLASGHSQENIKQAKGNECGQYKQTDQASRVTFVPSTFVSFGLFNIFLDDSRCLCLHVLIQYCGAYWIIVSSSPFLGTSYVMNSPFHSEGVSLTSNETLSGKHP